MTRHHVSIKALRWAALMDNFGNHEECKTCRQYRRFVKDSPIICQLFAGEVTPKHDLAIWCKLHPEYREPEVIPFKVGEYPITYVDTITGKTANGGGNGKKDGSKN